MCVGLKLKLKAINPAAPARYRVSCGKCEECRAVYKESWNFRLTAELEALMSNGWQCGFLTLTYNDCALPILGPSQLIDTRRDMPLRQAWRYMDEVEKFERFGCGGKFPRIPCFDRSQVSEWFISARQWLYRNYEMSNRDRLRYIACCEFGSHTQRPHLHTLLIFPKYVNAEKFFNHLVSTWSFYGFVFPKYFDGHVDGSNTKHKPFLVESYAKAARYTAKYTTKDLYYNEFIERSLSDMELRLSDDKSVMRGSLAFHCQSKSLGSSILDSRLSTDADKLNALRNGVFFNGEDRPRVLPVYLKNKILYDNEYVFEMVSPRQGEDSRHVKYELGCVPFGCDFPAKRVVRRVASQFFKDNIEEIFKLKVEKYSEFFRQLCDKGCMLTRRLALFGRMGRYVDESATDWLKEPYSRLSAFLASNELSCDDLAALYLCFYGVEHRKYCSPVLYPMLYLQRYQKEQIDFYASPDPACDAFLDDLFGILDDCFRYWCIVPKVRSEEERLVDLVQDEVRSGVY